jgi:hypothetical protein
MGGKLKVTKPKKTKNPELPGVEGPGVSPISIAAIDTAAEAYIKERDKRCAMTPREVAAKQKLIQLLHDNVEKIGKDSNGEIIYRYGDEVISLKPGKETLKVYNAKEEE